MPALLTRRSMSPAFWTAAFVPSTSERQTHTGMILSPHCATHKPFSCKVVRMRLEKTRTAVPYDPWQRQGTASVFILFLRPGLCGPDIILYLLLELVKVGLRACDRDDVGTGVY